MPVPRARLAAPAAAFLVAFALMPAPVAGAGPTCDVVNRTIVPHPHYFSLQDAVDAATAGDVLRVTGTCVGHTDVDRDLKIKGHWDSLQGKSTLNGGGTEQVLFIAEGVTVTLKWLTIRNGLASGDYPDNSGGGIGNEGTLILKRVAVRGNSAFNGGGISDRGTLTLNGHTVIKHNHASNDGGGIDVDATAGPAVLTMNGASRIRRNTAGWGAGVNVHLGSLTMNDTSSIYRNTASGFGGGIRASCGTLLGVVDGGNVHDNDPTDVEAYCL